MTYVNQTVCITGATRGIGRVTALHLAKRGHYVVATGRNRELLESLEREADGLPMTIAAMDVTDEAQVQEVVGKAISEHGSIDALVNNAGYGLWGPLEDLLLDEVRAEFETNVFAALRLSQMVLPSMRAQRFGTIVNVGSVSGVVGNPAGGSYAATKAALLAMNRIMRSETAGFGVRVVLVEPGLFDTDFQDSQIDGARVWDEGSPYRERTAHMRRRRGKRPRRGANPEVVAVRVCKCIEGRWLRPRYSVGVDAWLAMWLSRLLPDGWIDRAVRKAVGW